MGSPDDSQSARLGRIIRARRREPGLTQEELAEKLGLVPRHSRALREAKSLPEWIVWLL